MQLTLNSRTSSLEIPLIKLAGVTIARSHSCAFNNLNWEIKPGETWAITGPMGAGKTTLAEALTGKYPIQKGRIQYHLNQNETFPGESGPKKIALLSFSPQATKLNYKNYYYQQRYNSSDIVEILTVQDFLRGEGEISEEKLAQVIQLLKLKELLLLEVIKLSNGQTRKMLLARALLLEPRLLILDNPYAGLDTQTRQDLDILISNLIRGGTPVILITNQPIPEFVTHVLLLQDFQIKGIYTRREYAMQLPLANTNHQIKKIDAFLLFNQPGTPLDFEVAVKFENTQVRYGDKKILSDINWTIRKGEKWALVGPNGSGKTTLLSLINGDNPQAFANKITLFDRRKGSGESIWDIKKRIGFVSPELHLYFRQQVTGATVAASGFTDTLYLNRKISEAETQLATDFFRFLQLEYLQEKSFLQMSSGEQRMVLLIRSLVKNPAVLIWDEPFQNLIPDFIHRATTLLAAYASPEKTIILVSHYNLEIPDWISKKIYLENGSIRKITGT